MDKKELRRDVRKRIAEMTMAEKKESSVRIESGIKHSVVTQGARVVALFSPLSDEPQLWPLIEWLAEDVVVVLPRINGDDMEFYSYDNCLSIGAFGIMEPISGDILQPCEIDVMIVPGVAFTTDGRRMGRGKGFYDKYMSRCGFRALKIGVCYPVQLVDCLPCEEHDVSVDVVLY